MTTLVSYNILAGGYNIRENGAPRTQQLLSIIRSANPDIVGLIEATHPSAKQKPSVVEELAEALDMRLISGGTPKHADDYQTALLTRLPVIDTRLHSDIFNRALLEVQVQEADGQHLSVFVAHLSAAFNRGRAGGGIRRREVEEILRTMAPVRAQGIPHVLMGDFNSLAPGDRFRASSLVGYVLDMDSTRRDSHREDGNPELTTIVPPALRFLNPILRLIPRNRLISTIFNSAAGLYAPRSSIRLLREAGYVDSYRRVHPQALGFTCPAAAPAGRIDFIFASPQMAERLETCYVLLDGESVQGSAASDHLA
ncbi:MAG: endonuclease/exonuclease/phosphatase family protein, partial [Chloroflexota bacterium]|nr:endonuclease/exonuclease/phosphatase family protein [Chloroflexota bacterium]